MQYLYNDETLYHFMDLDSYEQVSLNKHQIEEAFDYLKEQSIYNALFFQGRLIAISAPMFMELKVTDAPPGIKGNTAQGGATKPVTLETGYVLHAPLFVEEGDILKVDTRTGEYIERIK
jgi:elongation factor P